MPWIKWLLLALGLVVLVMGNVLQVENTFQASTGWIGFFVFTAAFFVLLGVERAVDDAR